MNAQVEHPPVVDREIVMPSSMDILVDLARLYKIQPATALWRSVEIREVLKMGLPSGKGLDLGCGDGALTGLILKYTGPVDEFVGLDYDPGEIAVADRRGVYSSTIVSGGEDMPIEDASFDFVFSNSVLEHLEKLEDTISECSRILRPGGCLIATVPAPEFRTLLHAKGFTGKMREEYLDKMDARLAHHNYLDRDGWAAIAERHGMVLEHAHGYLNRGHVQRWEKLSSMTAGVLQKLGASNALLYRMQRWTRSDDQSAGGLLHYDRPAPGWARQWAKMVAGRTLDETSKKEGEGCLMVKLTKPA